MTTTSDLTVKYSGNLSIDGILGSDINWNWLTRSGNVLYYYFCTSDDSSTSYVESAMSSATQSDVASVLAQVTSTTGIQFQQTYTASQADIFYSMTNLPTGTSGMEWSNYNYSTSGSTITSFTADSYVWLDTDYSNTTQGAYGYQVLLHETGHAMGLDHPFEDVLVPAGEDNWDYTVMSYTRGSTGYQTVYQEDDVAALQWLYGTDGLDGVSYASSTVGTTTTTTTTTTPTIPTASVSGSTSVREGRRGTSYVTYTVTLSSAATSTVTVGYATSNGTATAGSDYGSTSGTLTIAAGSTKGTIKVPIYGDSTYESNETFTLTLSATSTASVSSTQKSVTTTIRNDDARRMIAYTDYSSNSSAMVAEFDSALQSLSDSSSTWAADSCGVDLDTRKALCSPTAPSWGLSS